MIVARSFSSLPERASAMIYCKGDAARRDMIWNRIRSDAMLRYTLCQKEDSECIVSESAAVCAVSRVVRVVPRYETVVICFKSQDVYVVLVKDMRLYEIAKIYVLVGKYVLRRRTMVRLKGGRKGK